MAGYLSMKLKRKDLEEVYDEFSEFSLSSPARKIRRLDAELPPIMEEEESGVPIDFDQMLPEEQPPIPVPVTESAPSLSSNEERALVLYKPMNTPLLKYPGSSNFSITLNSDLISGFKDQGFWSGNRNFIKIDDYEAEHGENENTRGNGECLAVVPWVSSQFPSALLTKVAPAATNTTADELSEPMEAEVGFDNNTEMEMEVDDDMGVCEGQGGQQNIESIQQWKQQHCMSPPHLPQNTSTPIMWSR